MFYFGTFQKFNKNIQKGIEEYFKAEFTYLVHFQRATVRAVRM